MGQMDVANALQKARNSQKQRIMGGFTNLGACFQNEDSIRKAEEGETEGLKDENPFEKAASESEDQSIEKSDIMDALNYGGNIKIQKTGKEIKEQVKNVVIPAKQAALAIKKAEADTLLTDVGDAPTHEVCKYWTDGMKIDVPYKTYEWEETYLKTSDDRVVYSLSSEHAANQPKVNCPKTQDEANSRRCYNDVVRVICEILVDIKACELLEKNLKDNSNIELTPRQVITLQFD